MSLDAARLSEELKALLRGIRKLLAGLSGPTMRRVPAKKEDFPSSGREMSSTISLLAMYNESLLKRVITGEAIGGGRELAWFGEMTEWTDLRKRQSSRRVVERKLREAFESLRLTIVPLDDETLGRVPVRSEEILEFLTLSVAVQSQLTWFLEV